MAFFKGDGLSQSQGLQLPGEARVRIFQKWYLCCEQPLSVLLLSPPEFVSLPFSGWAFSVSLGLVLRSKVTVRNCWAGRKLVWGKCRDIGTGALDFGIRRHQSSHWLERWRPDQRKDGRPVQVLQVHVLSFLALYDACSFIIICSSRWSLLWTLCHYRSF